MLDLLETENPPLNLDAHSLTCLRTERDTEAQTRKACARVPPLWPLKNFVAVNPFVGLSDKPFIEACSLVRSATHGAMLMPSSYYKNLHDQGRIRDADLEDALDQARRTLPFGLTAAVEALTVPSLKSALTAVGSEADSAGCFLTVADAVDGANATRWAPFIVDEISKWCSAYYDEGQASWRMPWRGEPLFAAWKQAALRDANPEIMGLQGFRAFVAALPDRAMMVIEDSLETLEIPAAETTDFLYRQLMSVAGWSGFVQYQVREKSMRGCPDGSLQDLLAIRLAYDVALYRQSDNLAFRQHWVQTHGAGWGDNKKSVSPALLTNYLWQVAAENAYQRELLGALAAPATKTAPPVERPAVQAVFCIDVRSEVYRRALEAVSPEVETRGFAGFFGFPIEYIPFGQVNGMAQCPVLLTPGFRIREHFPAASAEQAEESLRNQQSSRRLEHSWNAFKTSAVSCFSFVETAGLLSGVKLVKDSLKQHHAQPEEDSLAPCLHPSTASALCTGEETAPLTETGMTVEEQITVGAGALKNMGLTTNLARLVVFCGHGSSTTNNPYGSALDCGACGGHSGKANARVAAAVLNSASVREGLRGRGILVPDDTVFLAALHNTTTDEVAVSDTASVPASHSNDLRELQNWLAAASRKARLLRSPSLGLSGLPESRIEEQVRVRSLDWSQTRPEWGLAGNAAFIAAPRERTKGLNLGGRTFLNSYDYRSDGDGSILELIMTAPMVVASWINLQYFASTVNNRHFGSGNKTIHNVVGTVGIWQGNSGDLQVGLPLQSVHDGEKWMHEPLRLSVLIEAPRHAVSKVIAAQDGVRELLDNGWLHLLVIEDDGQTFARYCGDMQWKNVENPDNVMMKC